MFRQLMPVPGLGAIVFWEMIIFLAILAVGLAYVWGKGDLDWVKKLTDRSGSSASDGAAEEEVPTP